MPYNWPTKVKKFGIKCPLQKFIVAKYERSIWVSRANVDSPQTLDARLREVMLPALQGLISPDSEKNQYCQNLDLDKMLQNDAPHIRQANEIKQRDGEDAAREFLKDHINGEKKKFSLNGGIT